MSLTYHVIYPAMIAVGGAGAIMGRLADDDSRRMRPGPMTVSLWRRERASFTVHGWRYRNWSLVCTVLLIAIGASVQLACLLPR